MFKKLRILTLNVVLPVIALMLISGFSTKQPSSDLPEKVSTDMVAVPISAEQDAAELEKTIDELAKDLAGLLAHPGIRNQLRAEIKKSSKRESIIFLDEFLENAVKVPGLPDQAKGKASEALAKAKGEKKKFSETNLKNLLVSPEIDVYFPVKKHKDKWTGNDDVLVGVGTINKKATQIKTYSVKTGQAKMISASSEPSEPVIMVSPCEHKSHEAVELEVKDEPASEGAPNDGKNSYLSTSFFLITTDSEPWYAGDPEIYVLVAQYSSTAKLQTVKKYLPGVNLVNRWYYLGSCPHPLTFFWNSSYNPITYYKIMEEDTGWSTTLKVSAYGVTVSFPIKNADDDMGSVNVHRDQIGWCPYSSISSCCYKWTSSVSTGKAMMRMVKVH